MLFSQPVLHPPPEEPTLEGKYVIITGGNSSIGLSTARQLLRRRASTLVLAVRNIKEGEAAKSSLLSDPLIKQLNPTGTVFILKLDLDDYANVRRFASEAAKMLPSLHLLMLNAGVGNAQFEQSVSGHERTLQVNYLSNVLLLLSLLPLLRATAEQTTADGAPCYTRVTWTGSRAHTYTSLAYRPLKPDETILGHFDATATFAPFWTYADSKLLAVLFLYKLGEKLCVDKERVIVNMFCPGLVDTKITDTLPWYLRVPLGAIKALIGRSTMHAGWVAVNAAAVVGKESHGRFLGDMEIFEETDFIKSGEGRKMRETLWGETAQEMSRLVEVPDWMKNGDFQTAEATD